jgi:hypothetical protein
LSIDQPHIEDLATKLCLEMHDHPHPYPLGWVNEDAKLEVTKQCQLRFSISANYIDEIEIGVVFGNSCRYTRNAIFMRRENQNPIFKDGKYLIINAHRETSKISLMSVCRVLVKLSDC